VPTPTASDHIQRKCTSTEALNYETNKSVTLDRFVQQFPTPTADACVGCVPTPEMAERFRRKGSSGSFVEAMAAKMWPTPTSRDWKDVTDPRTWNCKEDRDRFDQLGRAVFKDGTQTAGGALNPTWVEWLMGFPLGWTVCDASGTRSSRKSSKSSGEQ
jgi:hypothetical protein